LGHDGFHPFLLQLLLVGESGQSSSLQVIDLEFCRGLDYRGVSFSSCSSLYVSGAVKNSHGPRYLFNQRVGRFAPIANVD